MASVAEICSLGECLSFVGKAANASDAELGLAQTVKRDTERAVRAYVGSGIVQFQYTQYLPRRGNPVLLRNLWRSVGHGPYKLRLPQWPVRDSGATGVSASPAVTEDQNGRFGDATNSFPSSGALTYGDDFYLEKDTAGLSNSGYLIRIDRTWYEEPGSYLVVYTAGWSADELDGHVADPELDASDIKTAVKKAFREQWNETVMSQSGAIGSLGAVKSVRLDDFAIGYDTAGGSGPAVDLPDEAKSLLNRFTRKVAG